MPEICVVADTHQKHRELRIPESELLIHCGDFCSFQREDEKTLEDVDVWFAEAPVKDVLCIGGNHDYLLQSREFRFAHARLLEDDLAEVAGLSIYGSPWCPDLLGFAYFAPEEELIEKWKDIPSGIDVLVTHTPPYGILDVPSSGTTHLGCPHLQNELKRIKPRVHLFGHVHASYGSHQAGDTKYVNAAMVGGAGFEVRHSPVTLNL